MSKLQDRYCGDYLPHQSHNWEADYTAYSCQGVEKHHPEYKAQPTEGLAHVESLTLHPHAQALIDLTKDIAELSRKKQKDYGSDEAPFANVQASEEFGVPGWVGAVVRLNDKVTRLKAFAKRGSLENESVEDSLLDIAVYSLIALVLYREEEPATLEGEGWRE